MLLYLVNLHMLQKYCIIILVSSEMIVEQNITMNNRDWNYV